MTTASTSAPHILLLQGPNMNYLGKRQPELYGRTTAAELDALCHAHAAEKGYRLSIFYTNSEGAAIDRIYQAVEDEHIDGLVMNPAAWSVGSGASLRYCILSVGKPYVEVHLRNQYVMKNVSTLADLALGVVQGFSTDSYILALEAMYRHLSRTPENHYPLGL
ncbi:type II 3-dehydroquinate dehydratase [Bosea sp. (in: a-proteobacteria)]